MNISYLVKFRNYEINHENKDPGTLNNQDSMESIGVVFFSRGSGGDYCSWESKGATPFLQRSADHEGIMIHVPEIGL